MKITIHVRKDQEWVIDALQRVVDLKRKSGLPSSLGYELLRTAGNGLTDGLIGAKLDRVLLGVSNASSKGAP